MREKIDLFDTGLKRRYTKSTMNQIVNDIENQYSKSRFWNANKSTEVRKFYKETWNKSSDIENQIAGLIKLADSPHVDKSKTVVSRFFTDPLNKC